MIANDARQRKLRFIFIAPLVNEEFYLPVKIGMDNAAALMGVDASFTGTLGVDLNEQAKMITVAASSGYDGIVVNLIDSYAFDSAVEFALGQGVPVLAFNTDAGRHNGRLSAIGQNPLEAGRVLGARVANLAHKDDTVLITMHDPGISCLEQRCAGISQELTAKGIRWRTGLAHSTTEGSMHAISGLLKEDASVRFVCATGRADTEGAGLVLERDTGRHSCGIAGFDLSPEILRLIELGIIKFTLDQQPYAQGFYPVVQLALYCRYGIVPSDMDIRTEIITHDSANRIKDLSKLGFR